MNKDQKKRKRIQQRQRAKQREIEKDREIEAEIDSEDEELSEKVEPKSEIEKSYYYPDEAPTALVPVSGPISFEEMDEEKQAQQEASQLMETTFETERIVGNILRNPEMEVTEKVDALHNLADDFSDRVEVHAEEDEKSIDFDALELEMLIAKDRRGTSAYEYFEDVVKRVLSSASRNSLGDSSFALVVNRGGKKVRKYPIHDKAHVRNALARASQMIARGGQAASDARAALPKIHAAAKRMGIGSSEKEHNAIMLQKDKTGHWRWVGWVSNNFIDWDGDIISEDAHKEFVEWWEKNKELSPAFLSWHTPGTARKNKVDFMTYENGFLICSGVLEDNEAANLMKAMTKTNIGMSHGTFVLGRKFSDRRVITKYRMYEVSDLPLTRAANPFTDFETISKEVGMGENEKLAYLSEILGSEDLAKKFMDKTLNKQQVLQAAGIESKEKTEEKVETKVETKTEVKTEVQPETKNEGVVAEVLKAMDIEGLNAFVTKANEAIAKVPVLEAEIKELKGSTDDKLAEMITPPAARFAWSQDKRPSNSQDNVVSEEEKEKAKPGVPAGYWLSELTGTAPVKAE